MNERIERLARAIALGHAGHMLRRDEEGELRSVAWWAGYGPWNETALPRYAENHWREYRGAAIMALTTMREPTDAMREAGKDHIDFDEHSADSAEFHARVAGRIFSAMIDAALK